MALTSAGYLSIAELVIYIPALVLAIIVCLRHGFARAGGWIYTIILCVVRITGAICQLLTHTDHSVGLLEATVVIDSIGISPLMLATLGLLSRFVDFINARGTPVFGVKFFRIIQLLIGLGLILAIVGGTSSNVSTNGTYTPAATSQAGIAVYIVAFLGMGGILVISAGHSTAVPLQERRTPLAVAIAFPFIAVRLLYSILAIFVHSHTFSLISGSVAVRAGMAVVEEFLVVVDYLILGFNLQKLQPEKKGEIASREWRQKQNRNKQNGRQQSG